MKTKIIGAVVVASSLAVSSAAFAGETISVVGSSSVSPLMEVLGETYAKSNDVTVEVQGPWIISEVSALLTMVQRILVCHLVP